MASTSKPRRPRSVSRKEAQILAELRRRRRLEVRMSRDADLLAAGGERDPYVVAHRMAEKGVLIPLGGGTYAVAPDGARFVEQALPFELALHARIAKFTDYFIAYMSALIEHGLTDLDSEDVFVATRAEPRRLEVAGRPIVMTQITSARKWFGFEEADVERRGHYVRADIARALVDCLDRPRLCGTPEVAVRAWERALRTERVDLDRLSEYAVRLGRSVTRRSAYWLSQMGRGEIAERLRSEAGALRAPVLLDASRFYGEGPWRTDRAFGVVVNIPEHALRGWIAYAK